MERTRFNNDFFNSYYYSNIIDNVLSGEIELLGFISSFKEFYGYQILKPFEKFSAFQYFICHTIGEFFTNDMYEYDLKEFEASLDNPPLRKLYAEWPLFNYGIEYSFQEFIGEKSNICWKDIEAYHEEISLVGYLEELFEKISQEVFYLLFNNRELLMRFNLMMTHYVSGVEIGMIEEDEINNLLKRNGVLKRVNIPEWVRKAVYFRDRGHCCNCNSDISGLLSLSSKKHFDHVVPLTQGGLNDVSNIQLLCENCNLRKGGKGVLTSKWYEKWY